MVQIIARGSRDGTVNLYARIFKRNVINNAVALSVSLSDGDWHSVESQLKMATDAKKMGVDMPIRDSLVQNLWRIKNGLDAMLESGDITPNKARQYVEDILRDQNDANEIVAAQMEAISESLAELATKVDDMAAKKTAPRNQIGFEAIAKRYEEEAKKKESK